MEEVDLEGTASVALSGHSGHHHNEDLKLKALPHAHRGFSLDYVPNSSTHPETAWEQVIYDYSIRIYIPTRLHVSNSHVLY